LLNEKITLVKHSLNSEEEDIFGINNNVYMEGENAKNETEIESPTHPKSLANPSPVMRPRMNTDIVRGQDIGDESNRFNSMGDVNSEANIN
jgi:hypothetical protein